MHRDANLPSEIAYQNDGIIVSQWYVHDILQQETTEYPELAFEDLVKPAFSQRENIREPAFAGSTNIVGQP